MDSDELTLKRINKAYKILEEMERYDLDTINLRLRLINKEHKPIEISLKKVTIESAKKEVYDLKEKAARFENYTLDNKTEITINGRKSNSSTSKSFVYTAVLNNGSKELKGCPNMVEYECPLFQRTDIFPTDKCEYYDLCDGLKK